MLSEYNEVYILVLLRLPVSSASCAGSLCAIICAHLHAGFICAHLHAGSICAHLHAGSICAHLHAGFSVTHYVLLQFSSEHEFSAALGCGQHEKLKVISIFGNTGDGKSHTLNHTFFGGKEVS